MCYSVGLGERNATRYWQRVWVAKVLDRGDKRFVVIDEQNPHVSKFNNNFDMVDRLTRLRNDLVSEKIATKGDAGDDEDEPPPEEAARRRNGRHRPGPHALGGGGR